MTTTENGQRDELARIIDRSEHYYDAGSRYELVAMEAAEAILSAGYCKPPILTTVEEIEIGYVCLHGHFQFHGDSDGDTCGTKRVGTVYVRADAEPNPTQAELAETVGDSMSSLHRKIEAWRKS